ncbi:MAG: class I SAM-dependent methyltransferase [Rhodospirillales bacterium]
MFWVRNSRDDLVSCLPKGGRVAEIGVGQGLFAQVLLKAMEPSELHLIDPWEPVSGDRYTDPSLNSADDIEVRYNRVMGMFERERDAGQVFVHRGYSQDILPTFDDASFDFIYVDGLHTQAACARDLALSAPKIKPGGFLGGHDYTTLDAYLDLGYGVVEAVNGFVRGSDWMFAALTHERAPSYLLAREPEADLFQDTLVRMLTTLSIDTRITNFENKTMKQRLLLLPGDQAKYLFCFDD